MYISRYLFIFLVLFSQVASVQAQQTQVNVVVGLKQNRSSPFGPKYVFMPSLEIERVLVPGTEPDFVALHGSLNWSFWKWTDPIREPFDSAFSSLTSRGHILGARLIFFGTKQVVSTRIVLGASRHLLHMTYLNDDIRSGVDKLEGKRGYWSFDPGLMLNIPLYEKIEARGSALLYVPVTTDEDAPFRTEFRYMIGASYRW